jgi:hypothetical protein
MPREAQAAIRQRCQSSGSTQFARPTGFGAFFADPDDVAGVVVGDDGQELMVAFVRDLVDADALVAVEPGVVDVVDHDAGDDRVGRFPGASRQTADAGRVAGGSG